MLDMEWEDTGPVLLRQASGGIEVAQAEVDFISITAEGALKAGENQERSDGVQVQRPQADEALSKAGDMPDENERPLKRRRHSDDEKNSSVRVVYTNLTRGSRKKLQDVLKQWSEWSGHNASGSKDGSTESGDDVYFPALGVGDIKGVSLPVWIDRPVRKGGKEQAVGGLALSTSKEREAEIPLYDRMCNPVSSQDSHARPEGSLEIPRLVSRCFNCGSYSHALKECPRPRDQAAINNSRKQRGSGAGPRPASRYYHTGKFEGLRPGFLSKEARESLGIGELDPPPWLNRMREIGYPPGYIEVEELSGVEIIGEGDAEADDTPEEGEVMNRSTPPTFTRQKPKTSRPARTARMTKKLVEYPGLNAPIPEGADQWLWASPTSGQAPSSGGGQRHHTPLPFSPSPDGTSPPGCPFPDYLSFSSDSMYSNQRALLASSPSREYSPIRHPSSQPLHISTYRSYHHAAFGSSADFSFSPGSESWAPTHLISQALYDSFRSRAAFDDPTPR